MSELAISIGAIEIPVADQTLLGLLWHKGSPWVEDIKNRLEGKYPGSTDRFWVARDGPNLAAHVWYAVSAADPRLGLLGHVFTRPEYRRQGLSTRLIDAAMADFRRQGGEIMQLFTYNPPTVPFYERLGFEQVYMSQAAHSADWAMRWPAGSNRSIDAWLAPAECRIRPLAAEDLPKYCLLYNLEYATELKDWPQEIGLGLEAELAFLVTVGRVGRGQGVCLVLDNGQMLVGMATLMRSGFAHQAHVGAMDYYVHPRFRDRSGDLLRGPGMPGEGGSGNRLCPRGRQREAADDDRNGVPSPCHAAEPLSGSWAESGLRAF